MTFAQNVCFDLCNQVMRFQVTIQIGEASWEWLWLSFVLLISVIEVDD